MHLKLDTIEEREWSTKANDELFALMQTKTPRGFDECDEYSIDNKIVVSCGPTLSFHTHVIPELKSSCPLPTKDAFLQLHTDLERSLEPSLQSLGALVKSMSDFYSASFLAVARIGLDFSTGLDTWASVQLSAMRHVESNGLRITGRPSRSLDGLLSSSLDKDFRYLKQLGNIESSDMIVGDCHECSHEEEQKLNVAHAVIRLGRALADGCLARYLDSATALEHPRSDQETLATNSSHLEISDNSSTDCEPPLEDTAVGLNQNSRSDCEAIESDVVDSESKAGSTTQTLIFLDWDDTLCPTTWIWDHPQLSWKEKAPCFAEPSCIETDSGRTMLTSLEEHQNTVINLLRTLATLGQLVIVTLAKVGWVAKSCEHFMPRVLAVLEELQVETVYAYSAIPEPHLLAMQREGNDPLKVLKARAMLRIIDKTACARHWTNIVSIGDSTAERLALQDIFSKWDETENGARPNGSRCKILKLYSKPTLEILTAQLQVLGTWIRAVISTEDDVDIDFEDMDMEDLEIDRDDD